MILALVTLLLGLQTIPPASAQEADMCRQAVTKQLAIEHRLFRSTIFGEPEPADAPISHVTFSKANDSWIKTASNKWQSLAQEFQNTEWNDQIMKTEGAIPPRKGIFETKRLLTSDLIPYVTGSLRTFDCRLRMFCETVRLSANANEADIFAANPNNDPLNIRVHGCEAEELPIVAECTGKTVGVNQQDLADALTYCNTIQTELLEREKTLMVLTTEYDASYRSTVQFAGDFDLFIEQIRWPMTNTIRQVIGVIGSLHRVPCFVASCEDGINYPDAQP